MKGLTLIAKEQAKLSIVWKEVRFASLTYS